MRKKDFRLELEQIVRKEKWLMDLLRSVRDLHLPDWYLAAGVIRNTVWDVLHGYAKRTPLNDIDVVYFDPHRKILVAAIEKTLHALYPQFTFEVVNQAFVHETYKYKAPVKNSCEAIGYFIEVPTCVGVRLEADDSLIICAPHGLKDLFSLTVAQTPAPYDNRLRYAERMKAKQWAKIWPKLRISL